MSAARPGQGLFQSRIDKRAKRLLRLFHRFRA